MSLSLELEAMLLLYGKRSGKSQINWEPGSYFTSAFISNTCHTITLSTVITFKYSFFTYLDPGSSNDSCFLSFGGAGLALLGRANRRLSIIIKKSEK